MLRSNRTGAICTMTWLISAAISLSTTKYLLDRRMHYPMHLLLLQLLSGTTWRSLQWLSQRCLGQTMSESRQSTFTPYSLIYTLCLPVGLVCAYQAVHHTTNVPIVLMACSLSSLEANLSTPGTTPTTNRKLFHMSLATIIRITIGINGIALVVLFEYRLSTISIIMTAVSAALFYLTSRVLVYLLHSTTTCDPEDEVRFQLKTSLEPTTLGLLGGILAASFWCHFREQNFWRDMGAYNPLAYNVNILALNLISSGLAFGLSGSVFSTRHDFCKDTGTNEARCRPLTLVLSVALVSLSSLGSLIFPVRIPYALSIWQWIGYIVILVAMLPIPERRKPEDMIPSAEDKASPTTQTTGDDVSEREGLLVKGHEEDATTNTYSTVGIAVVILLTMAMLSLRLLRHPASTHAILDDALQSSKSLEIVVARYQEPASQVAGHIATLLTQPKIRVSQPTFRIYNKNEAAGDSMQFLAELDGFFDSMQPRPKLLVHTLPNIGREADTYLAHITTQWDNLANHTLFIQADPHAETGMLQLIREYFVPETGFLSLSHAHTANKGYCRSCDDCYDRDWTEHSSLLHELYNDFNHGHKCTDILLTYRGQFIASAARIRGNKKEKYTKWMNELRDPEGQLHTPPYTASGMSRKVDSLTAPRSGFTLERMWATMLQCGDVRIATRCPSWLSSVASVGGRVEFQDCQCLDG